MPLSYSKTIGGRNRKRKSVKKTGKVSWINFVTKHYYQQSKKNKNWTFKDSLKQSKKLWRKPQKNDMKKGGEESTGNYEPFNETSVESPAETSVESPDNLQEEPKMVDNSEQKEDISPNLIGGKNKKSRSKR
jgi:hypothetical protein